MPSLIEYGEVDMVDWSCVRVKHGHLNAMNDWCEEETACFSNYYTKGRLAYYFRDPADAVKFVLNWPDDVLL